MTRGNKVDIVTAMAFEFCHGAAEPHRINHLAGAGFRVTDVIILTKNTGKITAAKKDGT